MMCHQFNLPHVQFRVWVGGVFGLVAAVQGSQLLYVGMSRVKSDQRGESDERATTTIAHEQ